MPTPQAMIAVVTGSSGFIGSHLVEALLARGATVRALVRPESPSHRRDPRVSYHVVDLLDDRSVRESSCWDGVTHVFHAAGVTKRRTLSQFRYGNVVPTANVLAALGASRTARLQRFVLLSSQAAAGPAESAERPVREDDRPRPIEAYGQSKLEAETAALRYAGSLPITIVRPSAVYGPRDVDFLSIFKQAGRRIAVYAAPADQQMSIVHARDLVQAVLLAADAKLALGATYFVGSSEPVTWRWLYEYIATRSGSRFRAVQLPKAALTLGGIAGDAFSAITGRETLMNGNKMKLAQPAFWICDSSRARAELGWAPLITLQDGLRETHGWYREAGWLPRPRGHPRGTKISGGKV